MVSLFEPLTLPRGPAMKNRFLLAPMTNQQARDDGTLTDDELNWLLMRATGDFSLVMTCCSHVHLKGQGFPGELGVYSDALIPGLERLAGALRGAGAISSMQLYHGGIRTITPDRAGPSAAPEDHARAMTVAEVRATIEDFIVAAERAKRAGFDGVELHGAHGYLISAFLSSVYNRREDHYGGSPEKRRRFLLEIVDGIRASCGEDFQIGVRVSPERFGQDVGETSELAQQLIDEGKIDYLDISLWDVFKDPVDPKYQGRSLMSYFTELDLKGVRLGFAGKINSHADATRCLEQGADFVVIGRAAIAHHNLPKLFRANPHFIPQKFPVTADYLRTQGLGESFIAYLATWPDMVINYFVPPEIPRFDVEEFFKTGRSVKLAAG
ncbi:MULTISPECIES: NADH:flavin oxidoreductase [unclassified Sphingopyxis]|uniref:NADH:flavin oxidoreductase n=1 Tax=unclassified Sphingopyxis TaxID=2614943 RepID=UPI0009EC8606|nr:MULTISPECIES: NADH:flavin oxidoreductase [unclassified Sphingopyxis]